MMVVVREFTSDFQRLMSQNKNINKIHKLTKKWKKINQINKPKLIITHKIPIMGMGRLSKDFKKSGWP